MFRDHQRGHPYQPLLGIAGQALGKDRDEQFSGYLPEKRYTHPLEARVATTIGHL